MNNSKNLRQIVIIHHLYDDTALHPHYLERNTAKMKKKTWQSSLKWISCELLLTMA